MSAKNEIREKLAYTMLTTSLALFVLGWFVGEGWRYYLFLLAIALFMFGGVMAFSVSLIKGVPWVVRLISHHTEPEWDGEILHTDGGRDKIRYRMDHEGRPMFVAADVCSAIGLKPPLESAIRWGGVPLREHERMLYFSEAAVQEYLCSLATKNHDANRLLLIIRNNILRKLDRQKELDSIHDSPANNRVISETKLSA